MNASFFKALLALSCILCPFARICAQQTGVTPSAQPIPAVTTTPVVTTGGKNGLIPVFTGTSTIGQSIIYQYNGGIGIGTVPSALFDVNGTSIYRGILDVARTANATPTAGTGSWPFRFSSQQYNSAAKTTVNTYFQLQAEASGNNTASTAATLNLLYYNGGGPSPAETGLYFNPNGTIHFASAQTFPITTGPTGPQGPAGPTGPQGPQGVQGPAGPAASIPANLTALSGQLSTNNGVAYLGATTFSYPGTCVIGDVFLSVNGYTGSALPADGRLLPISGNTALFSLIGVNFGGNGTSNYALPDLRAFAPQGMQYSICLNGIFPPRN